MVRVGGGISADISDRIARALGEVRIRDATGATLGAVVATGTIGIGDQNGLEVDAWLRVADDVGTHQALRNLRAGAPRFSLAVGDAELAALYSANLYENTGEARQPNAAGNAVEYRFRNPVGSAERHVVTAIRVRANTSRQVSIFLSSPAAADLVNAMVEVNKAPGGAAATLVATAASNNPAAAGTVAFRMTVETLAPLVLPFYYRLDADTSLGVRWDDAGNVTTDVFNTVVEWYEEAT